MTLQAGDIVFVHTYGDSKTAPPAGHYGVVVEIGIPYPRVLVLNPSDDVVNAYSDPAWPCREDELRNLSQEARDAQA